MNTLQPRLSLTVRISGMFMLVVVAVLSVAGLSFTLLSAHHFRELDDQALYEKLDAVQRILQRTDNVLNRDAVLTPLRSLLSAHQDLYASIISPQGRVLYSNSQIEAIPELFRHARKTPYTWEWTQDDHLYRGITASLAQDSLSEPLVITLMLDVTTHAHFFETLRQWFWIALVLSALASAALGFVVVRRGLRPINQVAGVAADISAHSLQQRIPLEPVPIELQKLVLSFNDMLDRLEGGFERLSEFSADIAHELRTPLSNLMTHTEVTLNKPRSIEAYQDALYSNLEELNRLARMIDEMLLLAKADNGLLLSSPQEVELADIVHKLFDYYQLAAEDKEIQLEMTGTGKVMGDSLMLNRAISNLLSNALRYTRRQQKIALHIQTIGPHVVLSVQNHGSTINAQHLSKLFERFYRADPARREGSPHNAGLGLAITQSIIHAHQGSIRCESDQGVTTFYITLPSANT